MNIFLTGATGFIGLNLARAFHLAGLRVFCAVRDYERAKNLLPNCQLIDIDFADMKTSAQWLPHLRQMDAVVNAVGIFEQREPASFAVIHTEVPCALFEASAIAGIKRIVQISALGATIEADTEFMRSKARADEFLLQRHSQALVLQPSLVFGEGGSSSELFVRLAGLPVLILPDGGKQIIQPVHIDDVATTVLHYLEKTPAVFHQRIAAVGAVDLSLCNYIQVLRKALGHADSHVVGITSETLVKVSRYLPIPWFSADAMRLLKKGSYADVNNFSALLDRDPLAPHDFAVTAKKIRSDLAIRAGFFTLRCSIALVWIVTGIVSLGFYPVEASKLLLARVGIAAQWQESLLFSAAILDIAFGVAILFLKRLRLLWLTQIATIVFYSAVIAWKLPEFWLHPYAPMLKNIPLLAAIYLMMRWENDRIRTR